jgi:hypothetical protein
MHADTLLSSVENDERPDDDVLEAAGILMKMRASTMTAEEWETAEAMLHLPFMRYVTTPAVPSIDLNRVAPKASKDIPGEQDTDSDATISNPGSLPSRPEGKAQRKVSTRPTRLAKAHPPPTRRASIIRLPMPIRESLSPKKQRLYRGRAGIARQRSSKKVKWALDDWRNVSMYRQERSSLFRLFRD